MKIILSGGGSGGHVTPLKYVAEAIKELDSSHELLYVGSRNDSSAELIENDSTISGTKKIFSGKWRRYSDESLTQKLLDVRTNLLNMRDMLYVLFGTVQALRIIRSEQPDAVLLKGGYVCVPMGFAAKLLSVPIVTHDSDTIAGLSNKIVGRWAKVNAVGQKHGTYPYPSDKLQVVGVPINPRFLQEKERNIAKKEYKSELGFKATQPLVFVTGGSLGASSLNDAVAQSLSVYIENKIQILILCGVGKKTELNEAIKQIPGSEKYIHVQEFEKNPLRMMQLYLAADIVIARAGTTTIAELSALGVASIIVPAAQLSDQVSNAKYLSEHACAKVVYDDELKKDPEVLAQQIIKLLTDTKQRQLYAQNLAQFTDHHAAKKLAHIIVETGERQR